MNQCVKTLGHDSYDMSLLSIFIPILDSTDISRRFYKVFYVRIFSE